MARLTHQSQAWHPLPFAAAVLLVAAAGVYSQEYSKEQLLGYMLDRPGEPIYLAKGSSRRIVFKVPAKYLRPRLQPLAKSLMDGEEAAYAGPDSQVVNIRDMKVPALGPAAELGRYERFSTFIPRHRHMAKHLVELLLSMSSYDDFMSASAFCREHVNPFLFAYALSVAILHRPDTRSIPVPNAACHFPQKYFERSIFPLLYVETALPEGQRTPIVIPREWTASDLDPEHRVAYFREDVGINLAHWQWHLVYPFDGPTAVVNKDRRGELFYYFHQQIIARFNFERLSNHMGRVKRLMSLRDPIPEAYFPKLDSQIASRVWPPRQADVRLSDIQREDQGITFDLLDLERWRDRFFEAIHMRRVQTDLGEYIALDDVQGIDILGNMMESSVLSINRNYYGDLHNLGHVAIAYVHDPDNRHLEPFAVMGDPTTAMRDPLFYRWHAFVNDVFQEHKATLPSYTPQQLGFPGIEVVGAKVQTLGIDSSNEFRTFWQERDIDLSRGLDFQPRGPVYVRYTHLQHAPFVYSLQVRNSVGAPRDGTVRIFLAPALDERRLPLAFRDQRPLFIELDKFRVRLAPGVSSITRWHNQSSVAIPPERTFRNLDARPPGPAGEQFDYCGCGWPRHMLIPRGSPEGMRAHLFVMVSDYAGDRVDQPLRPNACAEGHSYCGLRGQLYPDRRAMGFPMDRLPPAAASTLRDFLLPNMRVAEVLIVHDARTLPPAAAFGG